jgi:hypothetical protein
MLLNTMERAVEKQDRGLGLVAQWLVATELRDKAQWRL